MRLYQEALARVVPLLLTGCGPVSSELCPRDGEPRPECVQQNQQAGRSFQGRSFQGRSFQGTSSAVALVQQVRIGGVLVEDLRLQGTLLTGSVAGRAVSGADFIGATVTQKDADGSRFDSAITGVRIDPRDPAAEIVLYTLTAPNPDTGALDNLCSPDPWGERWATAVYGTWDASGAHVASSTQFMFACTSGVVAKCARWGYKPWKSVNGRSLADYHQACTRMARADYCGDGTPHTQDGTLIDMYDDLRIQVRSPPELLQPMIFDAAWSTRGAYCMTKDRWLKLLDTVSLTLTCKTRFLDLSLVPIASPVDARDLCALKRGDVSPGEVHIDNQSGINLQLL